MENIKDDGIHIESYEKLVEITNRLYCASQTLMYGNDMMYKHLDAVTSEICTCWAELDSLVEYEKARLREVTEEMKKFQQGFAYLKE